MSDDEYRDRRIAYLEQTVDELSDVVARQDREITKLARQVRLLMEREAAREVEGGGGAVFGDERPPHY